jgi:lipid A 3-O-deacylase
MAHRIARLAILVFLLTASGATAAPAETVQSLSPGRTWELEFETGSLWSVGGRASPLNYVLLPQMLTWRGPAHLRRPWAGGELLLRPRFTLFLQPVVRGPERLHAGGTASGMFEWWNLAGTRALFASAGGGLGSLDSRGYDTAGGQGQDLNFNWFVYAGARLQQTPTRHVSIGLYFQHLSNTGLDKINPGIDALGPMLNVGWRF